MDFKILEAFPFRERVILTMHCIFIVGVAATFATFGELHVSSLVVLWLWMIFHAGIALWTLFVDEQFASFPWEWTIGMAVILGANI
jgi:hypothetical protein